MSILKNVVRFTGLAVGVPVVLPHYLNLNTTGTPVPLLPQFVATNAGGFTVTVTDLTVTATRTPAAATGNVLVYVEHWHSVEEVLPPGNLATLVPFVIQPGTGGGGGGVDTDGVTIGGDGTAGNALFVIPSGLDEQVAVAVDGVTVTGDGTTANPLVASAASTTVTTDGTTIAGDGSLGAPLAVIPAGLAEQVAVAVDGVTITGDGTTANPLVAAAASGLTVKSGTLIPGAFSGNPKVAAVVFATPFPSTAYAIVVTPMMAVGVLATTVVSKLATGFTLSLNSNNVANLIEVGWHAIAVGG